MSHDSSPRPQPLTFDDRSSWTSTPAVKTATPRGTGASYSSRRDRSEPSSTVRPSSSQVSPREVLTQTLSVSGRFFASKKSSTTFCQLDQGE
jgi:hypothetical protein